MVSGWRSLTTRSMARACTSSSGSASSEQIRPMSLSPGMAASASSAALRTILLRSFSWRSSACGDIRPVEAAEQFDDVQTYRGILAFDAGNQVGNEFGRGHVGQDAEHRGLFLRLQVIGAAQQFARVDAPAGHADDFEDRRLEDVIAAEQVQQLVAVVTGGDCQCLGDAADALLVAVAEALHEHREAFVIQIRGQHRDQRAGLFLVDAAQRVDHRGCRLGADCTQGLQGLVSLRTVCSVQGRELREATLGLQCAEELHTPRKTTPRNPSIPIPRGAQAPAVCPDQSGTLSRLEEGDSVNPVTNYAR
jgi:hypothetical protein